MIRKLVALILSAASAAAVAGIAFWAIGAQAAPPYPNSMASTGDSITRAFDVGWCCTLADAPQ